MINPAPPIDYETLYNGKKNFIVSYYGVWHTIKQLKNPFCS